MANVSSVGQEAMMITGYLDAIVTIGFIFVAVQLWSIDHQLGRIHRELRSGAANRDNVG